MVFLTIITSSPLVIPFLLLGVYIRISKKFPISPNRAIIGNKALYLGWFFIINAVLAFVLPKVTSLPFSYLLLLSPSIIAVLCILLFGKGVEISIPSQNDNPLGSTTVSTTKTFGRIFIITWIVVTVSYVVLFFASQGLSASSNLRFIAGFFGLFVPIGPYSLMVTMVPAFLISNIVAILLLVVAVKCGNKWANPELLGTKRVLLALFMLIIITIFVDTLRGNPFLSWILMFRGFSL